MTRFVKLLFAVALSALLFLTASATAPSLVSESAVLIDADSGQVLYEKDMHRQMYPASITKILTVITGLEKLSMTEKMTMSHYAVFSLPVGSSHIALDEGEEITMEHAVYAALLMSANDACNGIAEKAAGSIDAFTVMMNDTARKAGAKNSNFVNAHGLSDENHYTTAYDMAMICRYALQNETFRKVFGTYKYIMPPNNKQPESRTFINQHLMVSDPSLKYDGILGGKAGWTSVSKCTLVTAAERDGKTLIAVVMKCVKDADKYADTKALLDYGFSEFDTVEITTRDLPKRMGYTLDKPIQLRVKKGTVKEDLAITTLMEDGVDYVSVSLIGGDELGRFPCTVAIDASVPSTPQEKKGGNPILFALMAVGILLLALILLFALFVLYIAIRKKIVRARRRRRRRRRY